MLDINCLTVRSKLTKEELLHSISFSVGEGETVRSLELSEKAEAGKA